MTAALISPEARLPERPGALSRPGGWWGMVLLICTEATLFLLLIASYFYLRVESGSWPPAPHADPRILRPLLVNALLVASSVPMLLAVSSARAGRTGRARIGLGAVLALGLAFLAFQGVLVHDSLASFRPHDDAYSSIYYTLIGAHYAHVAVGLLLVAWTLLRAGRLTPERHLTLQVTVLYWQFVNVLALLVFLTLYVSPRV